MAAKYLRFEDKVVFYGAGAIENLVPTLKQVGIKHCFICTDEGLSKSDLFKELLARFDGSEIKTTVFNQIVPNPRAKDVMEGARQLNECGADCVIGFGGGSSMDSSKVIAAMTCNEGNIVDYETHANPRREFVNKKHYTVGIPTTAGTGSEMDATSVVVNDNNHKVNINGQKLSYDLVIADSDMIAKCPPRVIAGCGIDAFCHSFEAVMGNRNMLFDKIAIQAASLVYKNLLGAYKNRGQVYREHLMAASFFSGCVMGHEPTPYGVPVHSIGLPLSEKYHYSHGESLALVLPYVLDKIIENDPHKIATIAREIGVEEYDDMVCAKVFVMNMQELLIACNLVIPNDLVASKEDIKELADMACMSKTTTANKILPFTNEMCQDVYQKAFDHYLIKM